ncbi:TVP38/TMEM64 family membrane protein [Populus alba x Populus x berolinensis]|uniref:TVP38/TMEM64 family membrane protein n=1 Tax=Populus alba x Populus x berolinensis TaxID=444605 RepID=A0AAD6QF74_9ROSI|nr:TVP38/TMEM64 family membrane protein [Populus alba x Populus x berolinensis]
MLNYLLSITPVPIGEIHAGFLDRNDVRGLLTKGRESSPHRRTAILPITLALVYIGTTLKDLSDVTHGWSEFSTTRWVLIVLGLVVSVVLMFCVTKVAKSALDKALAENEDLDVILASPQLPIVADTSVNLNQPLIIKIDPSEENHEQ